MTKLLILDDPGIRRLLGTPSIVQAFPFLKSAVAREKPPVARKAGCGGCRRKQRANVSDYEGIRAAIGGLSNEHKDKLKQMLGADQIRIYFTNPRRQRIKLTF